MLAESLGDQRTDYRPLSALCTRTRPSGSFFVTRVAILARGLELGIRMVRPDIRGLHTRVIILTVRNCISREILHPCHLTHSTPRVLYEIERGLELLYQVYAMLVCLVTELGILAYGIEILCNGVQTTVVRDCRYRKGSTIRAHPHHVGMPELL